MSYMDGKGREKEKSEDSAWLLLYRVARCSQINEWSRGPLFNILSLENPLCFGFSQAFFAHFTLSTLQFSGQ